MEWSPGPPRTPDRGAPDAPGVKACCKVRENLTEVETAKDRFIATCGVCGCRHFRVVADPGLLGVRGSGIGG